MDHGKSSVLEKIREISITKHEAGGITQKISSFIISIDQVKKICGSLLNTLNLDIKIPGLLAIDTPGHAAFTNLRKRGGNLADIAILVIDIKEGIMPQTKESIELLKASKTPFIIALNKIDNLSSWRSSPSTPLLKNIQAQPESTLKEIETKLYDVVTKLAEFNLNAERFDRVDDYTKQIAIIPCSAKTGEGIPEVLMVLTGLAQKYLEECLTYETKGPARGTILEIKEEKGLGKVLNTIIYDGTLKQNDKIVIATLDKPIITKVKAIFEESKGKLVSKKEVSAAASILISAPELEEAIAGMPIQTAKKDIEKVKQELQKEVEETKIESDREGIIVKADTIGSLEAIINLLKEKDITIRKADIGEISKKDVAEAKSQKENIHKVALGFNVKPQKSEEVKIITNDIIYKIIEDYQEWTKESEKQEQLRELKDVIFPAKIHILQGCIFRQSNPAVVGISVLEGKLKNNAPLMKLDGSNAGIVKSMQLQGENIQEAIKPKEIAISIPKITVGRQIHENDILLTNLPEADFIKLKKLKKFLNTSEIEVLKEIALLKRKTNPLWGV